MATLGSKLKVRTKDLTLAQTRDTDDKPVVVTIRRVSLSRLARIFRAAPGFVARMTEPEKPAEKPAEAETPAVAPPKKPVTPAEAMARMGDTEAFYTAAQQVVIAACLHPRFYDPTDPPVGVDLFAPDSDWAEVDSVAESDQSDIMHATLELSGYFVTSGEAKDMATFPAGDRGRGQAGGPDGETVPAPAAAVPDAGDSGQ